MTEGFTGQVFSPRPGIKQMNADLAMAATFFKKEVR